MTRATWTRSATRSPSSRRRESKVSGCGFVGQVARVRGLPPISFRQDGSGAVSLQWDGHMILRSFAAALLLVTTGVGCSSTPSGEYSQIAKHPHVLSLEENGRYLLRQEYTDRPEELGRWWRVTDTVVVLLPDDESRREHYARVDHGLRLSGDLRGALPVD